MIFRSEQALPTTARAWRLEVRPRGWPVLYVGMVGTLQLSRALADQPLADAVLDQGIENALALLDAAQQS